MRRQAIIATVSALSLFGMAAPAMAAQNPVPSTKVCSGGSSDPTYACMQVSKRKVPSGDPAVFSGALSSKAMSNLSKWTKGDNIVCLTRYKAKPEADGGWPSTTLEGACTTVRKDGGFAIVAELGRKGRFYYGLVMGPCQAGSDLCGNGDPGLIGVLNNKNKALVLRTT